MKAWSQGTTLYAMKVRAIEWKKVSPLNVLMLRSFIKQLRTSSAFRSAVDLNWSLLKPI